VARLWLHAPSIRRQARQGNTGDYGRRKGLIRGDFWLVL
jgi:hypothetical protein